MKNNQIKKDELGSIGIGAMIVFIALILVAAVASAVIIQTGEKLQQNAQQSGSDTQQEISGKITVNSMFVFDPDDSYLLYFETAPGSEVITPSDVQFQLTCEDTGGDYEYVAGDFTNADDVDDIADDNGDGAVDEFLPGVSYSFVMDADTGAAASCDATSVGVNGEVTLWIHVGNGGSTYETLYISDDSRGSLVI